MKQHLQRLIVLTLAFCLISDPAASAAAGWLPSAARPMHSNPAYAVFSTEAFIQRSLFGMHSLCARLRFVVNQLLKQSISLQPGGLATPEGFRVGGPIWMTRRNEMGGRVKPGWRRKQKIQRGDIEWRRDRQNLVRKAGRSSDDFLEEDSDDSISEDGTNGKKILPVIWVAAGAGLAWALMHGIDLPNNGNYGVISQAIGSIQSNRGGLLLAGFGFFGLPWPGRGGQYFNAEGAGSGSGPDTSQSHPKIGDHLFGPHFIGEMRSQIMAHRADLEDYYDKVVKAHGARSEEIWDYAHLESVNASGFLMVNSSIRKFNEAIKGAASSPVWPRWFILPAEIQARSPDNDADRAKRARQVDLGIRAALEALDLMLHGVSVDAETTFAAPYERQSLESLKDFAAQPQADPGTPPKSRTVPAAVSADNGRANDERTSTVVDAQPEYTEPLVTPANDRMPAPVEPASQAPAKELPKPKDGTLQDPASPTPLSDDKPDVRLISGYEDGNRQNLQPEFKPEEKDELPAGFGDQFVRLPPPPEERVDLNLDDMHPFPEERGRGPHARPQSQTYVPQGLGDNSSVRSSLLQRLWDSIMNLLRKIMSRSQTPASLYVPRETLGIATDPALAPAEETNIQVPPAFPERRIGEYVESHAEQIPHAAPTERPIALVSNQQPRTPIQDQIRAFLVEHTDLIRGGLTPDLNRHGPGNLITFKQLLPARSQFDQIPVRRILTIGAGIGEILEILRRFPEAQLDVVDYERPYLMNFYVQFAETPKLLARLKFYRADARSLPADHFPSGIYDFVYNAILRAEIENPLLKADNNEAERIPFFKDIIASSMRVLRENGIYQDANTTSPELQDARTLVDAKANKDLPSHLLKNKHKPSVNESTSGEGIKRLTIILLAVGLLSGIGFATPAVALAFLPFPGLVKRLDALLRRHALTHAHDFLQSA